MTTGRALLQRVREEGRGRTDSGGEKVNILLVDDQPSRLLSYHAVLEELGQNLVDASSGIEALERLMKDEFAVVLLDVSMPGMDGFETAELIHDHPRYEHVPIIFVTGVHDTELDRLKGYKLGAVDYVSIPIVPEILRSKVSVLVELYCQRRELQRLNRSLAEANTNLQTEKARELELVNRNLQEANQRLQAADRQKDEFIAILAHELRNPLAPIRSATQIMANVRIEDPQLKWSRDVIDRQVTHLSRLVDDLLDVSRLTSGTIKLSMQPLEIGTILSRAIESAQPFITARRHHLEVECADDGVVLQGDLTRLVQVLSNLLNNAAKYMEEGGTIRLGAYPSLDTVEFRVKDAGIGIETEAQPKLFNMFSRVGSGSTWSPSGIGIGLALVRQLVELHGGTVSVMSAGVAQGSEFTVTIPLGGRQMTARSAPSGTIERVPQRNARRVLVADDNIDALDGLAMLVEIGGHETQKARDGMQALALAGEWRPDLALLDIGMPGLDGYEVARRIRVESWGDDIMLVAVSGWGQAEDRQRAADAGFDLHLVKPISFEALEDLLKSKNRRKASG